MKLRYTLSACVDCVAYTANYDIPEDRPDLAQEIATNLGTDDMRYLACASGLDESGEYYRDARGRKINSKHPEYEAYCEDWFAWSACECCGSSLGGMRNQLAVFRTPNKREAAAAAREARKRRVRLQAMTEETTT